MPLLGGLLVVYLAFPLVAFAVRVAGKRDRGFGASGLWSALGVSVEASTISLVLITLLGVPLAHALATHPGWPARVVGTIVQLPLALPPLMSGILLIYVAGPYTTLGRLSGGRLTESLTGVVISQSFVAAPFLVIAARSAFAALDPALGEVAATLGHRPMSRFFRVDLRCAGAGIRAGMVLTWLRAFGEYGATVIVAYHPFSLPIYTDNRFEAFPLSTTEAPTLLALAVAVVVVTLGQLRLPARRRRRALPAPRPPAPNEPTPVGFALDTTVGSFRLRVSHPAGASRLAVLGPSGSGKSLTLRALAGLLGPGTGDVTFGGEDVSTAAPSSRRTGYVPQGLGLIPGLTVTQQVCFGAHADPALAAWWLATLHLQDLAGRRPDELSGGQRQRVSLARALAADPGVVLLDEPFSALDAPVREELRRELRRLQQQNGLSTVLVTHDPEEAAYLAEEIVVIAGGEVLQAGPVAAVFGRPASLPVARLLGIDNVHDGVVTADGSVLTGSVALTVAYRLPAGAGVLWRVPSDRISLSRPDAPAVEHSYPGTVLDVVDMGVSLETTVRLDGGPELRCRASAPHHLAPGAACLIHLAAQDIVAWTPAGR